jgi:hypothetical protein
VAVLAPLTVLASSAIIFQASNAAFTAQTSNPSNNWQSGTVTLADNDSSSALFSVTNIKPGDTGTRCIEVTYGGSVAAAVKLYASNYSSTTNGGQALGANLNVTVEQGTGDGSYVAGGGCTGFVAEAPVNNLVNNVALATFAGSNSNWATSIAAWSPAALAGRTLGNSTEKKVYRITWTFPDSGGAQDLLQSQSAQVDFTWEARSS